MKFPIDKEEFVSKWLEAIGEPDEGDEELARAIAHTINRAYYAGRYKRVEEPVVTT